MYSGAELLVDTIGKWLAGSIVPQPQDSSVATYARKIDKKSERIDWTKSAIAVANLVRGLNPSPGAYTVIDGKTIKIWQAAMSDIRFRGEPGEVVEVNRGGIFVMCGEGCIAIEELQLAGAAKQKTAVFVNSGKIVRGDRFE